MKLMLSLHIMLMNHMVMVLRLVLLIAVQLVMLMVSVTYIYTDGYYCDAIYGYGDREDHGTFTCYHGGDDEYGDCDYACCCDDDSVD